jgi:hypothetical protein
MAILLKHGTWRAVLRDGQEILLVQTVKAIESTTVFAAKRLRRQRGGFMGAVGFSKQGVTDTVAEQMIRCRQKALFGGDTAEDEVWMFGIGGQELTRCFNGCMSRLHGHLRRRQIAAHEHVEMWNLAERLVHMCLRYQSYP